MPDLQPLFGVEPPASPKITILPIPFDATASYRKGAALGPAAIVAASAQVDLSSGPLSVGQEELTALLAEDPELVSLNESITKLTAPISAQGEFPVAHPETLAEVNKAGEHIRALTHRFATRTLDEGGIPVVLGGEHSTPLGSIEAVAARHPGLGLLQIDAHMDFREAFQGFTHSHAAIAWNVLDRCEGVAKLVQFGIRDYSADEMAFGRSQSGRVVTITDFEMTQALHEGRSFASIAASVIDHLPELVYISFDIDGLDPALCPHTGTPVPGGLLWGQINTLLLMLARSGRRVVGFDLVEVAPGEGEPGDAWDANVGARVLHALLGVATLTNGFTPS
ncbi:MAG: arginase [Phycisphaerales bacterium]|nr:MAG: arginase [Phycisphaerales bacterium]